MADDLSDLMFLGETLVGTSNLIEPGTISVMLADETIHDVPTAELRRRCEAFGSGTIRAFLLSPAEFEKVKALVRRREEEQKAA